ncbi:unnamed protein product, partial [marine sediment metagenome]
MKFNNIPNVFYKIDSVQESGSSGVFTYYDVTFYPALDDPDNFNTNQDIS